MSALKALHTTVEKADPGDAGWIWFEGKWHVAQIVEEMIEGEDCLFVEIMGNGEFENVSPPVSDRSIGGLHWYPINRPSYDGNERPSTHALTMQDRDATWTLSWSATEDEGAAISRSIFAHAQSLLKTEKGGSDA